MENITATIEAMAQKAQHAAQVMASISTQVKNQALEVMAQGLQAHQDYILAENQKDLERGVEAKLSTAMLDRLRLTPARLAEMRAILHEVAALPDPVGETRMWKRPNNLQIGLMRVPIGVIGIIYESRPNVTVDAAALCLKAGNAVILRGGSEAIHSNLALQKVLTEACRQTGLPEEALQVVPITDRAAIFHLLSLDQYIDLIVARGGEGLIRTVTEHSRIPVIKHDRGLCHTYVDSEADLEMALKIVYNAKVQRPSVCNAMETLLVHEEIAEKFLPACIAQLEEAGVEVRGCERTCQILPRLTPATAADWDTEYLDLILSVRVVPDMQEAIAHIARHGSKLSEAIVTNNYQKAREFLARVDAAAVYVNASTRFTDGHQFGLGTELGISTQKLHVRGPMGLEHLTSTKYIVFGEGQIRE
ncbi:MAG: glutamate-5-semialdehyde dehydrogenase [Nitrospinota bacterium]|nr:MAG: glutamate-5-semialdehyde dehydrogenase [Nitrospinota bacterium]